MRIIDAIRRPGISIEADHTVHEAAALMERTGVGCLAVLDGGQLVGVVTDRDLVRRVLAPRLALDARIDAVMTMPVESIDAGADLHEAVRAFRTRAVRRLAVTEQGQFVGTIAIDDLIINLASDLSDLTRPLTAEVLFSHHDAPVPVRPMTDAR